MLAPQTLRIFKRNWRVERELYRLAHLPVTR
jgi:hypothetical protein